MNFDGHIFWHFLWYRPILDGVWTTLYMAVIAQFAGVALGLFLTLSKLSHARFSVLRSVANVYIWFFRGTPLLVQIIFVYDAVPQISNQTIVLGAITSAIIALSLNEAAYMAEIIRAGIQSVDRGQVEAAKALGMPYWLSMRRIILPQAVRFIIPPTSNEFISMLKNTSLATVVAAPELLGHVQEVYDANFAYFELLSVACIWYLALTTVATYMQTRLEAHYGFETVPTHRGRFGTLLRFQGFAGGN